MTEEKLIHFERVNENLDYDCLQKYNEHHFPFSMEILFEKNEDDEERFVGYDCLYRYDQYRIQLEYHILTGLWKSKSQHFDPYEQKILNHLFEELYQIRCLTLDEQIQLIVQRLNQYFDDKTQNHNVYRSENKIFINSSTIKDENPMKTLTEELIELPLYPGKELAIDENHEDQLAKDQNSDFKEMVDYGLQSLVNGSRQKFSGLGHPPPVAPRRSRQNSACSTQSSIRYASFLPPPPSAPLRRRRVIESIVMHVQRKKKPFEKLVDAFKQIEPVTMYDLGMEFLRLYDGKFNYREGHTFVILFRKRTWFLTIDKIRCIECEVGEKEPRSALLLRYKDRLTRVQV